MIKWLAKTGVMLVVAIVLIAGGVILLSPVLFVIASVVAIILALIALVVFAGVAVLKNADSPGASRGAANLTGSSKAAMRDARHYARLIKKTVQQCEPGPVRSRLERSVQPVDDWMLKLNQLEQSLGKLYGQRNLARDMQRANFELEQLRKQVLTANSVREVESLRALMKSKKKHYAALEEIQSFQTQAELKIRKIASDLGATHAEILLVATRGDFSESRFNRLDENLQENMAGLRDILTAMDEIGYMSGSAV